MASTSAQQSLCLPFNEAITKIPLFMQGNDDNEKHELEMFFNVVDQLHQPRNNISARKILNYFVQLFPSETTEEATSKLNLPEGFDELFDISGEIAMKIVSNVINGSKLHNITVEVLNILQQFSWETKVALVIATYTLTFGDSGLNLYSESKVVLKEELPIFLKQLLDVMNWIAEFEKLPVTYMTSEDKDIKDARTHFIVAIYWIIRAIVATSTTHISITSSRWEEFGTKSLSTLWVQKLEAITTHLQQILHELEKLQEDEMDMEAYEKLKEIVHEKDHDDNMKVLNALFSITDYDTSFLYHNFSKRRAHVDELKDKNVLLLISSLDINPYEFDTIKMIYDELKKEFDEYEMVWIPVVDRSIKSGVDTNSVFEKLRTSIPWYSVYHPSMIKNAVKKFLVDDWKFAKESMMVVLDQQGNVVNENAMHMMLLWHNNAVPFTSIKAKTLLNGPLWKLELLISGVDEQVMNWIENKERIFMYGGEDMEWIREVTSMVNKVAEEWKEPIKMVYGGRNDEVEDKSKLVEKVINDIKNEKLSHCFSKRSMWHFWRRKNALLNLMIQHLQHLRETRKISEILLLDKNTRSKVGWFIFGEGSYIWVCGDGKFVLSTFRDLRRLVEPEDTVLKVGKLIVKFALRYSEQYRKEVPDEYLQLPPTTSVYKEVPELVDCPHCLSKMRKTIIYVCNHPSNECLL